MQNCNAPRRMSIAAARRIPGILPKLRKQYFKGPRSASAVQSAFAVGQRFLTQRLASQVMFGVGLTSGFRVWEAGSVSAYAPYRGSAFVKMECVHRL